VTVSFLPRRRRCIWLARERAGYNGSWRDDAEIDTEGATRFDNNYLRQLTNRNTGE